MKTTKKLKIKILESLKIYINNNPGLVLCCCYDAKILV